LYTYPPYSQAPRLVRALSAPGALSAYETTRGAAGTGAFGRYQSHVQLGQHGTGDAVGGDDARGQGQGQGKVPPRSQLGFFRCENTEEASTVVNAAHEEEGVVGCLDDHEQGEGEGDDCVLADQSLLSVTSLTTNMNATSAPALGPPLDSRDSNPNPNPNLPPPPPPVRRDRERTESSASSITSDYSFTPVIDVNDSYSYSGARVRSASHESSITGSGSQRPRLGSALESEESLNSRQGQFVPTSAAGSSSAPAVVVCVPRNQRVESPRATPTSPRLSTTDTFESLNQANDEGNDQEQELGFTTVSPSLPLCSGFSVSPTFGAALGNPVGIALVPSSHHVLSPSRGQIEPDSSSIGISNGNDVSYESNITDSSIGSMEWELGGMVARDTVGERDMDPLAQQLAALNSSGPL